MSRVPQFGIVVPVLNAVPFSNTFIDAIRRQTAQPERTIVLDSESTDGTSEVFRAAGFEVWTIPREQFDHGGTRNYGMSVLGNIQIVIFLTQDAILADQHSLEKLLQYFTASRVAIVFGRQLPRAEAGGIESHARLFNYPARTLVRRMPEAAMLGVKAAFNSNSFAAYRQDALRSIGGFPPRVIMGEDQYAAGKLILNGWSVVYAANATVVHSHRYTVRQDFRRYFDMGVFHARNTFLIENFGDATGEGFRFIRSEIAYLAKREPWSLPSALARTSAKLIGYRLGRHEAALSRRVKRFLSMQPGFFQ